MTQPAQMTAAVRGGWIAAGAASGLVGVAIGAFGAHALADLQAKAWIDTGARYHLIHTMALLMSVMIRAQGAPAARFAHPLFLTGVIVFAGSLYALALGAPRWAGAITPIGGLCLLAGWGALLVAGLQIARGRP